jgi:hypothetical protein
MNAFVGFFLGAYSCGVLFCYVTAKDTLSFGRDPEWAKVSLALGCAILWPLGFVIMVGQMLRDLAAIKIAASRERLRKQWIDRMTIHTQKR